MSSNNGHFRSDMTREFVHMFYANLALRVFETILTCYVCHQLCLRDSVETNETTTQTNERHMNILQA